MMIFNIHVSVKSGGTVAVGSSALLGHTSLIWSPRGKTKIKISNQRKDKGKLSGVELESEEMAEESRS
jgi:hypothetical protein